MIAGDRPRLLVAEPDAFDSTVAALLSDDLDVVLRRVSPSELAKAFSEFDAIWIRLGYRVDDTMLPSVSRCRVLACPVTGLDHIDVDACRARGIQVISLKGEVEFLRDVRATAEHTVALMLGLLRKIPWAAQSVLEENWDRDRFRGREIRGKVVGLVGVGRLGSLVARMLGGFDSKVIGFDPRADFPSQLAERVPSMQALLERADIVSVHVGYDSTTHHLLGATEFAHMRACAFLINTSRGGVLDEAALLSSLASGAIAGAALDVIEGEPHPVLSKHPLVDYARSHENLLLVPHIGGNTWESTKKTELFIAHKVLGALANSVSG